MKGCMNRCMNCLPSCMNRCMNSASVFSPRWLYSNRLKPVENSGKNCHALFMHLFMHLGKTIHAPVHPLGGKNHAPIHAPFHAPFHTPIHAPLERTLNATSPIFFSYIGSADLTSMTFAPTRDQVGVPIDGEPSDNAHSFEFAHICHQSHFGNGRVAVSGAVVVPQIEISCTMFDSNWWTISESNLGIVLGSN